MTSDVVDSPALETTAATQTLRLLAGYLALTVFPVLRAAMLDVRPHSAIVAAVHVTVLAVVVALIVGRRWAREKQLLQDDRGFARADSVAWVPLVLLPALYAEVPTIIAGLGGPFHDATVQVWEAALFGGQPARTWAAAFPSRGLSELLHAGYLSYYALIYLPPALLFARGKRAEFARTVFALTAVWLICLVAFALFPVAGPRYEWSEPPGIAHGPIRATVLWLLEAGSARGTAFPSSHVAVAVVQTLAALAFQRRVGVVTAVATVLLACGAVYGGFHYAIDVIAGAALGLLVGTLTLRQRPLW